MQTLASQGITEIVIPGGHRMDSTSKQRTEVAKKTSQSFAGTTYADAPVEEKPDPDSLQVLPDAQDVTAKSGRSEITISSKAAMTVFRMTQEKKDKFTRLHEFALGNVAQRLANDLDAGTIKIVDGVLGVNLNVAERDAQSNLKNMMYAEPELGVYKSLLLMSLDGKSTRTEVHESNKQVAEVFFANEDSQQTTNKENKPPSVDAIEFSNKTPRPGDTIYAKLKGTDPESMALNWEWRWVGKGTEQSGQLAGSSVTAKGLQISNKANDNDSYKIQVKLIDELGAFVTSEMSVDAIKPKEPPQVTFVQGTNSVRDGNYLTLNTHGKDADGHDDNLRWDFAVPRSLHQYSSDLTGSTGKFVGRNSSSRGTHSIGITLTDNDGLTAYNTFSYQARRNSDPLIFDLNGDDKVTITGGEVAHKPVSLPSGVWNIQVVENPNNARYIINDANINNGAHNGNQRTNASGQWKVGIENNADAWTAVTSTILFKDDSTATITGGGMVLEATRISDSHTYDSNDLGVKSAGGAMVEFDMQPDRASWEFSSKTYRPGLGAPTLRRGKAAYDSGKSETIGEKWREDTSKGNKAKLTIRLEYGLVSG